MHLNTYLTHEGTRYEIYWTSQYAQHVLENYVADANGGLHLGIDHLECLTKPPVCPGK